MRFLCFLLGSALLHAGFLALPLSTGTGDAGKNAPEPLRVRLLGPGIPKAEAANMETPRQPVSQEHEPAGGSVRTERPQHVSMTDEAASRQVPRERPQALAQDRTTLAVRPPAAPEAPDGSGRGRGTSRSVEEAPGETPGRERGPWASPGGETMLALAPDPERRRGPRASPARGAGAARTPVRYARVVKPKYPRKARTEGWEGTTVLKVRVDRGGRPGLIAVDRSSGFEVLDRAAVRAMRRWEFHPARNGRGTIASWVKVPVSFRIEEDRP